MKQKSIVEIADEFFARLNSTEETKDLLRRFDQKIQFELKDDKPFYVWIRGGEVSITEGEAEPSLEEVFTVESDRDTLMEIFSGKLRPFDAICQMKLHMLEVAKSPIKGWLGKLIRIGQDLR